MLCVCLAGSPRHWTCTVGLCQGKQPHLSLYAALQHSQSDKEMQEKEALTEDRTADPIIFPAAVY